jgi:hypothetical protein
MMHLYTIFYKLLGIFSIKSGIQFFQILFFFDELSFDFLQFFGRIVGLAQLSLDGGNFTLHLNHFAGFHLLLFVQLGLLNLQTRYLCGLKQITFYTDNLSDTVGCRFRNLSGGYTIPVSQTPNSKIGFSQLPCTKETILLEI